MRLHLLLQAVPHDSSSLSKIFSEAPTEESEIMATFAPRNPEEVLSEDLTALRSYAERVILRGDTLTADEEDDRETRFREFADIGDFFKLTEREMVNMLFEGILHKGPRCWCAECRPH